MKTEKSTGNDNGNNGSNRSNENGRVDFNEVIKSKIAAARTAAEEASLDFNLREFAKEEGLTPCLKTARTACDEGDKKKREYWIMYAIAWAKEGSVDISESVRITRSRLLVFDGSLGKDWAYVRVACSDLEKEKFEARYYRGSSYIVLAEGSERDCKNFAARCRLAVARNAFGDEASVPNACSLMTAYRNYHGNLPPRFYKLLEDIIKEEIDALLDGAEEITDMLTSSKVEQKRMEDLCNQAKYLSKIFGREYRAEITEKAETILKSWDAPAVEAMDDSPLADQPFAGIDIPVPTAEKRVLVGVGTDSDE